MDPQFTFALLFTGIFLALFGLAEALYRLVRLPAEVTRKFVHVSAGVACLFMPLLLDDPLYVLGLCVGFTGLLLLSQRWAFLPSVNAIRRRSYGSIAYPTAVFGCYLVFAWHWGRTGLRAESLPFFYTPMLILAVCDPLAAFAGKRWPSGRFKLGPGTKTLSGAGAFALSALGIGLALAHLFPEMGYGLPQVTLLALAATLAEALTPYGLDNLSIPATVALLQWAWT